MLGAGVQIIDNGEAIARQTRRLVPASVVPANAPPGQVSLFTTGQPQTLQAAAGRWLGLSDPVRMLPI
jgi:glutamate racemase